MKKFITVCGAAAICLCTSAVHAQKKEKVAEKPAKAEQAKSAEGQKGGEAMDQEAMMKAWQDYATPGEMHSMLSKGDGTWDALVTMWMDPKAPPTQSKGTCENKMIMQGRYQQTTFKGDFMGMPFEGMGTVGYDNARKIFINSWIDNMGTGLMYLEGKWNPEKRMILFTGKSTDPMTGKENKVREDFQLVDENTHVMTMYETRGGEEVKTMEIKFTRRG